MHISILENTCPKLCPIDCTQPMYFRTKFEKKLLEERSLSNSSFNINWDLSKPFITYKETQAMTFTDYVCNMRGLFGMWFGISVNRFYIPFKKFIILLIMKPLKINF